MTELLSIFNCRTFAFGAAILVTLTGTATAHPGHVSSTEVEWNPESHRFEVAMRLRIADLEDALSLQEGTRVNLETNDSAGDFVRSYLAKRAAFRFSQDTTCRLHWVGMELELHDVWLYFEAESVGSSTQIIAAENRPSQDVAQTATSAWTDFLSGNSDTANSTPFRPVSVSLSVLTEIHAEQANVVSLKADGRSETVVLTRKAPKSVFFAGKSPVPDEPQPKAKVSSTKPASS